MRLVTLGMIFLFLGGCSGGGDDAGSSDNAMPRQTIEGMVVNETTGEPVVNATVQTEPPTEQVTSSIDGSYILRNGVNSDTEYDLKVNKIGFKPSQTRVAVALVGSTRGDIQLQPIVNGMSTNVISVHFQYNESTKNIILASSTPDTEFVIQSGETWLSATPSQGRIAEAENKLIKLALDRSLQSGSSASTQLVFNATNGVSGLVLDITADIVANATSTAQPPVVTGDTTPQEEFVGEPGQRVDCRETLPCTWLSDNAGFEMTLVFADGSRPPSYPASFGPGFELAFGYRFRPLAGNTEFSIKQDGSARDTDSVSYSGDKIYAPDRGPTQNGFTLTYDVLQNTVLRLRHHFDTVVSDRGVLSTVTFPFFTDSVTHNVEFINVPFGREFSQDVRCALSLPCTWRSQNGLYEIAISSVKRNPVTEQLEVYFTVFNNDVVNQNVRFDYNSTASGNDSVLFDGPQQRVLGGNSKFAGWVTESVNAGTSIDGKLVFRTIDVPSTTNSLARLQLNLYKGESWEPLWNPVWFDLPVSR